MLHSHPHHQHRLHPTIENVETQHLVHVAENVLVSLWQLILAQHLLTVVLDLQTQSHNLMFPVHHQHNLVLQQLHFQPIPHLHLYGFQQKSMPPFVKTKSQESDPLLQQMSITFVESHSHSKSLLNFHHQIKSQSWSRSLPHPGWVANYASMSSNDF
jgi:hypothetical protein